MLEIVTRKRRVEKKTNAAAKANIALERNDQPHEEHDLWLSKHEPRSSTDLAISTVKVKALREWIIKATTSETHHRNSVLLLCGPPGTGKSTAVKLLCREINIELREWQPEILGHGSSFSDYSSGSSRPLSASWQSQSGDGGWKAVKELRDDFVLQSRYPSLSLNVRPSSFSSTSKNQRSSGINTAARAALTIKQQQQQDHYSSSSSVLYAHRSLILVEDGPDFASAKDKERAMFVAHLSLFDAPVVVIYSDASVKESAHFASDRFFGSRTFGQNMSNAPFNFECIHWGEVTEKRAAKLLQKILDKEHISSRTVSPEQIDELSRLCNGDFRQAVNQLQLIVGTHNLLAQKRSEKQSEFFSDPAYNTVLGSSCSAPGGRKQIAHARQLHRQLEKENDDSDNTTKRVKVSSAHYQPDILKSKSTRSTKKPKFGRRPDVIDLVDSSADEEGDVAGSRSSPSSDPPNVQLSAVVNDNYSEIKQNIDSNDDDDDDWRWQGIDVQKACVNNLQHSCHDTSSSYRRISDNVTKNNCTAATDSFEKQNRDRNKAVIQLVGDGMRLGTMDESFSGLHAVAKLIHSSLDTNGQLSFYPDHVFHRSEMPQDRMLEFMQANAIVSISESHKKANFCFSSSIAASAYDEVPSINREDPLDQLVKCLQYFSDTEVMRYRRYDPSAHLDRSDSFFPDNYVAAISSRASASAKGVAAKEAIEAGKSRGAPSMFLPVHRPKLSDLRFNSSATRERIRGVRDAWAQHLITTITSSLFAYDNHHAPHAAPNRYVDPTASKSLTQLHRDTTIPSRPAAVKTSSSRLNSAPPLTQHDVQITLERRYDALMTAEALSVAEGRRGHGDAACSLSTLETTTLLIPYLRLLSAGGGGNYNGNGYRPDSGGFIGYTGNGISSLPGNLRMLLSALALGYDSRSFATAASAADRVALRSGNDRKLCDDEEEEEYIEPSSRIDCAGTSVIEEVGALVAEVLDTDDIMDFD